MMKTRGRRDDENQSEELSLSAPLLKSKHQGRQEYVKPNVISDRDQKARENDRAPADIKRRRRLESIRRQLALAFSSERHPRLRASLRFATGHGRSRWSGAGPRTRSLESSSNDQSKGNVGVDEVPSPSRGSSSRLAGCSAGPSPRHLIRMFAELRDDSTPKLGGAPSVPSFPSPPPLTIKTPEILLHKPPSSTPSSHQNLIGNFASCPEAINKQESDARAIAASTIKTPSGKQKPSIPTSDHAPANNPERLIKLAPKFSLPPATVALGGSSPGNLTGNSLDAPTGAQTQSSNEPPRTKLYRSRDKPLQATKPRDCQQLRELLSQLGSGACGGFGPSGEAAISGASQQFHLDRDDTASLSQFDPDEARLIQKSIEAHQNGRRGQPSGQATYASSKLAESLRLQQDTILELIGTEINYIDRLRIIRELFLGTLERLQAYSNVLHDVQGHQLVSNIEHVLEAHLWFWARHLRPLALASIGGSQNEGPTMGLARPINPVQLSEAFTRISQTFKPYYRFCIEQASCITYIRRLSNSNECFRLYLSWCEQQRECDRMRLVDLLACPMQRLTRYPLLLRTILKQTNDILEERPNELDYHEQRESLVQMIALTDKFVQTVNLELKRRDEFIKLLQTSNRISLAESSTSVQWDFYNNQEVHNLLRSYSNNFRSLMEPLFECAFSCQRQLFFNSMPALTKKQQFEHQRQLPLGPIKFRDAQSGGKLDVILLVLTDQLLICRQEPTSKSHRSADHSPRHNSQQEPKQQHQSSNPLQPSYQSGPLHRSDGRRGSHSNFYIYSQQDTRAHTSAANLTTTTATSQQNPLHKQLPAAASDSYNSDHLYHSTSTDRSESKPVDRAAAGSLETSNVVAQQPSDDTDGLRPLFVRQRAASHSFEPIYLGDFHGGRLSPCTRSPTGSGHRVHNSHHFHHNHNLNNNSHHQQGDNLNLLSPARALVRPVSEQTLSSADTTALDLNTFTCQHDQGPRQQQLSPKTIQTSQQHLSCPTQRSGNSTSICSLVSNQELNESPITTAAAGAVSVGGSTAGVQPTGPLSSSLGHAATLPSAQRKPSPTPPVSPSMRSFQRQSMSLSCELPDDVDPFCSAKDRDAAASGHHKSTRTQQQQHRLTVIRAPYPIERLAVHELSDGRSLLVCQMNDTRTVANSFVVYFTKSGSAPTSGRHQRGQGANSNATNTQSQSCSNDDEMQHSRGGVPSGRLSSLSQAKFLAKSIREAQLRHRTLAYLHEKQLWSMDLLPFNEQQATQDRSSLEWRGGSQSLESSPKTRQRDQQQQQLPPKSPPISIDQEQRLLLIAEQHEMFLLSHGRHDELATHSYDYELSDGSLFRAVPRPISSSLNVEHQQHQHDPILTPSGSSRDVTAGQPRPRSLRSPRSNRPQLGRSSRIAPHEAASGVRAQAVAPPSQLPLLDRTSAVNSSLNSLESDLSNWSARRQESKSCPRTPPFGDPGRYNLFDRSADSERLSLGGSRHDLSEILTENRQSLRSSGDLLGGGASAQMLITSDAESAGESHRTSRRHLSSLRRQNVVMSASHEQHQNPNNSSLHSITNQQHQPPISSLNRNLLHAQCRRNLLTMSGRGGGSGPSRQCDSSSIDSAGLTSTDDSYRQRAQRNFVARGHYESSSVQTTTIDQTFDDTLGEQDGDEFLSSQQRVGQVAALAQQAGQPYELSPIRPAQTIFRLQSIRSVSTDQTSSPIAVTLTVPSRLEASSVREVNQQLDEDGRVDGVSMRDAVENLQGEETPDEDQDSDSLETAKERLLTGCLDIKALKSFREKTSYRGSQSCSAPTSPRPSLKKQSQGGGDGGLKGRLLTIMEHLHLR